jgi:hypothetical protein
MLIFESSASCLLSLHRPPGAKLEGGTITPDRRRRRPRNLHSAFFPLLTKRHGVLLAGLRNRAWRQRGDTQKLASAAE